MTEPDPLDPEPEPAHVRLGVPVAATVLAGVLLGAVLALPSGGVLTAVVVTGLVVQTALAVGRGLVLRRAARPPDRAFRWQRFVVAWSVQASLTWLVSGDDTGTSRWVYVGTGLAFAIVLATFLAWTEQGPRGHERSSDTRPLPVEPGGGAPEDRPEDDGRWPDHTGV